MDPTRDVGTLAIVVVSSSPSPSSSASEVGSGGGRPAVVVVAVAVVEGIISSVASETASITSAITSVVVSVAAIAIVFGAAAGIVVEFVTLVTLGTVCGAFPLLMPFATKLAVVEVHGRPLCHCIDRLAWILLPQEIIFFLF